MCPQQFFGKKERLMWIHLSSSPKFGHPPMTLLLCSYRIVGKNHKSILEKKCLKNLEMKKDEATLIVPFCQRIAVGT